MAGVKDDARAKVLPASRGTRLSDWNLRESIRHNGVLNPVVYHRGELIDGKRRLHICQCLRISVRKISIDDPTLAARHLWAEHPKRAYQLFAPKGSPSVSTLVRLFACPRSEMPDRDEVRNQLSTGAAKLKADRSIARLPAVDVPRIELQRAHATCRERGVTLSAALKGFIRYLAAENSSLTAGEAAGGE